MPSNKPWKRASSSMVSTLSMPRERRAATGAGRGTEVEGHKLGRAAPSEDAADEAGGWSAPGAAPRSVRGGVSALRLELSARACGTSRCTTEAGSRGR